MCFFFSDRLTSFARFLRISTFADPYTRHAFQNRCQYKSVSFFPFLSPKIQTRLLQNNQLAMLLSIQTTSQKTMLSDRSCWIQFVLILVLFVKPLLSGSDNSEKACSYDKYRLDLDSSHEKRKELAYEFCKDVFSQLFTSDWSAAYQTMITEMPSPAPVNEAIFKKCDALKLLTPEWTIGLLKTINPEARKRLMKKWERLLIADEPEKLKELIFLACTSTFNNEPNVVYIDWPDEIEEKSKKCPELTADPAKFDELQSQIKAVNKMTTKNEAEQSRKKTSYAFCHALFPDKFSGEWSPEIYSIQTEEWSLGVDVSLVEGCPFVALLQPEVRMMRERREMDSKLRRQLGKCLFWPLNSGAKEDEAMKDAILELCNFAFTQPVGGGLPTWAIILICVFSALLLLTFAVIAICAWRRHRIRMKFRRDAEAVWAERMMMNGEEPKSQMQLTKKTQDQSPPSAQEDTTCEDSARTIDMMPSEENLMPSEENLMQPSEENLQPQQQPKTERTMEVGSKLNDDDANGDVAIFC